MALESRIENAEKQLFDRMSSLESKLQQLLDAANMGRGAWWLFLKIGGIIVIIGSGLVWLTDKLDKFTHIGGKL